MAGGFRILESGDSRVSESGDSRITEELIFASCSLSTTQGGLILTESGDTRIDEQGNTRASEDYDANVIGITGSLVLEGAVSFSAGGGTLTAGEVSNQAHAELTSSSSISPEPTVSFVTGLSVNSSGSVVSDPDVTRIASTSLSSSSSMETSYSFVFGGLFTADPEDEYQRATEDGNVRVTESGDIRIVADVLPNAAQGIFNATYTYIAFSSTAYIKYNGEWTEFTPKVNKDGSWVDPLAIYKKQDSINWKRAY